VTISSEEKQEKFQANQELLYGGGDPDDPYGDVIDAEPVEIKEQSEIEVEKEMPLGQALGIALLKPAPKLGLEAGDSLLEAVKLDAKNLIEYLTKSSSYDSFTRDNARLQDSATVIFENWDDARQIAERIVQKGEVGEIEEMEVEVKEGTETPSLF